MARQEQAVETGYSNKGWVSIQNLAKQLECSEWDCSNKIAVGTFYYQEIGNDQEGYCSECAAAFLLQNIKALWEENERLNRIINEFTKQVKIQEGV